MKLAPQPLIFIIFSLGLTQKNNSCCLFLPHPYLYPQLFYASLFVSLILRSLYPSMPPALDGCALYSYPSPTNLLQRQREMERDRDQRVHFSSHSLSCRFSCPSPPTHPTPIHPSFSSLTAHTPPPIMHHCTQLRDDSKPDAIKGQPITIILILAMYLSGSSLPPLLSNIYPCLSFPFDLLNDQISVLLWPCLHERKM